MLPKPRPTLAIVTIATGDYFDAYFEDFLASIRDRLAADRDVAVFCFTDRAGDHGPDVHLQACRFLGWPFDSLMRFRLMNGIARKLAEFDTVLFMDSDMLVVERFDTEVFDSDLVAVVHPGYVGKTGEAPFEIDLRTSIPLGARQMQTYVQGCFFGGKGPSFAAMVRTLNEKVTADLQNGEIPVWHDESYLNWFVGRNPCTVVHPGYAYPERWKLPYPKKVIHRAKDHASARRLQHRREDAADLVMSGEPGAGLYRHLYLQSHEKVQRLERRLRRLRFIEKPLQALRDSPKTWRRKSASR
jgi:hypothetical protein